MATTETVKYCQDISDILNLTDGKGNKKNIINKLHLFGIKSVVDQSVALKLSETEKRRHESENKMLISCYTKDYSKPMMKIIREKFSSKINALKRPSKIFNEDSFLIDN